MLTHLILPRLHRLRPYSCGLLLTLLLTACVNDGGGSETAPASTKITATVRHTDGSASSASSASVGDLVELQAPPLQGDNATYQWYRNGEAISDATSASYNLGQVGSLDDKVVFTVQVRTADGKNTTSDPLPLTVSGSGNNIDLLAGWLGGSGNADGLGAAARFEYPKGITRDSAGNLYVVDGETIRKVRPDGMVSTLADKAGTVINIAGAAYITVDNAGNLYVNEFSSIRRISPDGTTAPLANASGTISLQEIYGLCSDPAGNLYTAGRNSIQKITPAGTVSTLAGVAGEPGNSDGVGPAARFNFPQGIACAANGSIYVADTGNSAIRTISPDGTVDTLRNMPPEVAAAVATEPYFGTRSIDTMPVLLAIDSAGNLFVTDGKRATVYRVTPTGKLSMPVAARGAPSDDRIPLFNGSSWARGITVDPAGNAYLTDFGNFSIRKLGLSGGVTTLAGRGRSDAHNGYDLGPVNLSPSRAISSDEFGNVYLVGSYPIRKITPNGTLTSVPDPAYETAGEYKSAVTDKAGNLYLADIASHTIRKVTPAGVTSIVAGSKGERGSTDGPASSARFTEPTGIAIDGAGNLYVAESCGNVIPSPTPEACGRIRKITPDGTVSTRGYFPDVVPSMLLSDASGNLFSAGGGNIYKRTVDGTIIKLAGSDGGSGTLPPGVGQSIAVDPAGNVYAAGNNSIIKIGPTGQVSNVAGTSRYSGVQLGLLPGGFNGLQNITFGYRNGRPVLFAFNMVSYTGAFFRSWVQDETNVVVIPLQ